MIAGQTYEITKNKDIQSYMITNDYNVYCNEVEYSEDGGLSNSTIDAYGLLHIRNKVRKQIRLSIGENAKYYIPYEHKDIVKINEINTPVFHEFKILKGESYILKNESQFSFPLLNNSDYYNKYNMICYDKNGAQKYSYIDQDSTRYVYAGETVVISISTGDNIDFYAPYELVLKELYKPFIESATIKTSRGTSDILRNYIYVSKKETLLTKIDVKVNWNKKQPGKILLQQGDKTISSTTGNFNEVIGNKFDIGKDVFIVAVDGNGEKSQAIKTNLAINNSTNGSGALALGNYNIGNTPVDAPILSFMELGLNMGNISFKSKYYNETNTYKFILGASKEEDFDKVYNQIKSKVF